MRDARIHKLQLSAVGPRAVSRNGPTALMGSINPFRVYQKQVNPRRTPSTKKRVLGKPSFVFFVAFGGTGSRPLLPVHVTNDDFHAADVCCTSYNSPLNLSVDQ